MAFPPKVSEHAIVRYAERIHPDPLGVPHHKLRKELQALAARRLVRELSDRTDPSVGTRTRIARVTSSAVSGVGPMRSPSA